MTEAKKQKQNAHPLILILEFMSFHALLDQDPIQKLFLLPKTSLLDLLGHFYLMESNILCTPLQYKVLLSGPPQLYVPTFHSSCYLNITLENSMINMNLSKYP